MKRLLAVIGAVAMIGAAVLIRGSLTGDGGGSNGGGGGGGGDGATHLLCVPELEAACEALAAEDEDITFDVEEAGDTAERLTDQAFDAAAEDVDGWLTLQPWPALVNERLVRDNQNPVLETDTEVLATAKLAIVGPSERIDLLTAACGGEDRMGWNCLGEIADEPWENHGGDSSQGNIEVGHDDPTERATGLLVLGQAASDYFDTTDFASNDFDADPGFRQWLGQLENAEPGLNPALENLPVLEQLGALPTASWDAVGTIDPQAQATKTRTSSDLAVLYPSPMIRAEVVLAPIRGHAVDISDDDLTAALEEAGWEPGRVPQDAPSAPSAGVYEALIQEWEQANR